MRGTSIVRLVTLFAFGLFLVAGSLAQESTAPAPSPSAVVQAQATPISRFVGDERYRIGPGDVLEIRVFERPQLTRETMRVDGNGRIHMPLIQDEVVAACRTEVALAEEIAGRYRTYLKNPQVDVFVKEFNSEPVSVIGAVNKPGSFQMQRRVRLRELLTFAGGPSPDAGKTIQVIHDESSAPCDAVPPSTTVADVKFTPKGGSWAMSDRTDADLLPDAMLVSVDLQALLRGDGHSNPYIRPGDFVHIPKADQVFVVGNVYKPSSLPLNEPLTVSLAIARAGGVLPNTKRSRIRIVRSGPTGTAETYVDLERIEQHEQADLLLKADDIVEVSTSIGKLALRGFIGGIVPAYAVYAPLTLIR
jgi:polysaccharide export outer membrane protein